jgi:hypothetical protein
LQHSGVIGGAALPMKSGRYLDTVRHALPENAQALLDRAFAGDALAARRLMVMAPRRMRGHIAFLAYQQKVANPAYREIVRSVWAREARFLLTEFWRPQVVRRMLARADFRIPAFAGPITVFQAMRGARAKKVGGELSWSLSREAALSEATRSGEAKPELLQATIEVSDIIYWRNNHGEQEIVGRRPVKGAVLGDRRRLGDGAHIEPATGTAGYTAASRHR